jgi:YHS domain-containing protein
VRVKPPYTLTRDGCRYLFPNSEHLEAFRTNPERYLR